MMEFSRGLRGAISNEKPSKEDQAEETKRNQADKLDDQKDQSS